MTGKISAKDAIILINGYNFSTYASDFAEEASANPIEVSGFGDGAKNYIPGLPTAKITSTLLWDAAANKVHLALSSLPNGIITIMPEGYVLGNPTLSLPFMQANYSPKGAPSASAISVGQLAFESYGNNVGIEFGVALAHATITTTTTGTGFIDPTGAPVTAACGAALHIWTPTATDTYVVKVQHSTTLGSGYADLITFAANGTSRTVERITVASGTINQYRRVVATRTGSAADPFGFSVHFYHL